MGWQTVFWWDLKKNAGDYDLNDLLYSGQDGYDIEIVNDGTKFIINKAQLTVTADGVEIDANSVLPDFTGSISGLVGGERWEDLGVELDSDLHFTTDADGKTAGKFAINGSLDKTLANYEIKQADSNAAALVVNKNDKPPQPPDLSNLPQEGIYQQCTGQSCCCRAGKQAGTAKYQAACYGQPHQ